MDVYSLDNDNLSQTTCHLYICLAFNNYWCETWVCCTCSSYWWQLYQHFFWRGGIGQFLGNHLNFNLFSCIKQFQIFYWHFSFSWRFVWQCHSVMNSVFLLKEFIITNTTIMAIHVCVTIEWTFFIVLNMPEIFTTEH